MTIPETIRTDYKKWRRFLEEQVEFRWTGSLLHTREHCARVLLFCLLIAEKQCLTREETNVLCMAAVFHDSCRQDDGYDVGHGQRAAAYYQEFCRQKPEFFDERVPAIMAFHDRDDADGKREISAKGLEHGVLLYEIFKDADALDRFRLGPDALDIHMLRTDAARELVPFAGSLARSR